MSHGGYDYGLEDKILRKNIPGRYGTWEKESDEMRSEWLEPEVKIEEPHLDSPDVSEVDVMNGPQTGPKGVLNHHKAHRKEEAESRRLEADDRQAELLRVTRSSTQSTSLNDDETELSSIRLRRLRELKEEYRAPIFGDVHEVDAVQFLDCLAVSSFFMKSTNLV